MKKDAEMHAGEDRAKKESIEAKNQAENTIYLSEKTLREAGDKVSAEERKGVEDKINDVKAALSGSDNQKIKETTEKLSLEISKIGAKMYQGQQQNPSTEEKPKDNQNEDKPQDAEFKEKP